MKLVRSIMKWLAEQNPEYNRLQRQRAELDLANQIHRMKHLFSLYGSTSVLKNKGYEVEITKKSEGCLIVASNVRNVRITFEKLSYKENRITDIYFGKALIDEQTIKKLPSSKYILLYDELQDVIDGCEETRTKSLA